MPRWNLLSTAALNLFPLITFENNFYYFYHKDFFVSGDRFARKDYFQRNSILTIFAQRLLLAHDGFSQRDVKRADFVSELLEKYLEPYLTYLEQVKDKDKTKTSLSINLQLQRTALNYLISVHTSEARCASLADDEQVSLSNSRSNNI